MAAKESLDSQILSGRGVGAIDDTRTTYDILLTNDQNCPLIKLCTVSLMSGQP